MNGLINWLNKHVVPIAARIGSIRWLVALRDAFIAIMPAMMAGAVSTVLNALIRDIPNQFGWTGFVNSMQWLIGINAVVWTGTLAILGLIFSFTFGYQLAVQYKVEPVTAGIVTLGTFIMSLPQNFTMTVKTGLGKAAIKSLTDAVPSAFALFGWFPSILREPLGASDTLSGATAPVKLPVWHCPTAGSRLLVRNPILQGWYPNSGSMATGVTISQPPTYPVHAVPDPSTKLE